MDDRSETVVEEPERAELGLHEELEAFRREPAPILGAHAIRDLIDRMATVEVGRDDEKQPRQLEHPPV